MVQRYDLHLVSDATGETIHSVARACLAQFDSVEPAEHHWSLVRTVGQIDKVLNGISANPGVVMFTIVDNTLRIKLQDGCRSLRVPCIPVLDPTMATLANYFGTESIEIFPVLSPQQATSVVEYSIFRFKTFDISLVKKIGINADGPLPCDTSFITAYKNKNYDCIVGMYHDALQSGLKAFGFDRGVTVQGGLPLPITTPAHGTAFDIAGQNKANLEPTLNSFKIALTMAENIKN